MGKITINGVTYEGNNLNIINGNVYIDGKIATNVDKEVKIKVEGSLMNLATDQSVECEDVHGSIEAEGSVNCEDVGGNVVAGGSVNCNDVEGNVTAGGSVNCNDVGGNVKF